MTDKDKKLSFKDFVKQDKPERVDEVILPANAVADQEDEALIPNLFATIHFKSDDRPNGYTDEDIENMNNAANAHLPHLQTKKTDDR